MHTGPDLARAGQERRSTATATYATRGVGLERLHQDAGITWLNAGGMTLHTLAAAWHGYYLLEYDGEGYTATRAGEGEPFVRADTLPEIESAVRAHYARNWGKR